MFPVTLGKAGFLLVDARGLNSPDTQVVRKHSL